MIERESDAPIEITEQEPIATVTFDFARHSIKESNTQAADVSISKEGMDAAVWAGGEGAHADEIKDQIARKGKAEVYGSTRSRTLQSSVFRMLGEHFKDVKFESVTAQEVVDWLREADLDLNRTELLDFGEGDGAYTDELVGAMKAGNVLEWTVEKSDQRAIETDQKPDVTPYSVLAANIANFIWVQGKVKSLGMQSKGEAQEMVFATSHQTILESFFHKALMRLGEDEVAKKFVETYANGFPENVGYRVEFRTLSEEENDFEVMIHWGGEQFVLEPADLFGIMYEGQDLQVKLGKDLEQ